MNHNSFRPLCELFGANDLASWISGKTVFESPIEYGLAMILEAAAPNGCRPSFIRPTDINELALRLEREGEHLLRNRLLVVPQLSVSNYRPDFTLVISTPHIFVDRCPIPGITLIGLEADGAEFHDVLQLAADLKRDEDIRGDYGIRVLRVSGAEIVGRSTLVGEAVALYLETIDALDRLHARRRQFDSLESEAEIEEFEIVDRLMGLAQRRLNAVSQLLTHTTVRSRLDHESLLLALQRTAMPADEIRYGHLFDSRWRGLDFQQETIETIRRLRAASEFADTI